jgi:hypothetical protein
MPASEENKKSPFCLEMRCCCGAQLFLECQVLTTYMDVQALFGLAKAWQEAHRDHHDLKLAERKAKE